MSGFGRVLMQLSVSALLATPAWGDEPAHFHHVRLNVRDARKSMQFYQRVFGAVPTKYRGRPDAMFVERSFLLFNVVDAPPESALEFGHLAHRLGRGRRAERV